MRDGGKEEKRGAHFYQWETFDSAEKMTLERKTKAAWLSLLPFVCSSYPTALNDVSATSSYFQKIHFDTFNKCFCY